MKSCFRFLNDRSKLNMSIDILMLLVLMAMAGIGFLIKYVLVSGEQRNAIYGENVNLHFLGLDRHEWGTIHLIASILFLVLIILHIILHWKMILCIVKRMIPQKFSRYIFASFVFALSIILFLFAFIIQPKQVYHENIFRNRTSQDFNGDEVSEEKLETVELAVSTEKTPTNKNEKNHLVNKSGAKEKQRKNKDDIDAYDVQGAQTLNFVSSKYNVPSSYICKELSIPTHLTTQRLGRLRKRYGFTMSDVSRVITDYKKQNQQ